MGKDCGVVMAKSSHSLPSYSFSPASTLASAAVELLAPTLMFGVVTTQTPSSPSSLPVHPCYSQRYQLAA